MPLPANDVFSFGLAHDEPRTSPTLSRTRTRSQSRGPNPFSTSAAPANTKPQAAHRSIPSPGASRTATSTVRREGMRIGSAPVRKSSGGVMTIRRHKRECSTGSVKGVDPVNGRVNGHTSSENGRDQELKAFNGAVINGKKVEKEAEEMKKVAVDWEIPRKALHSSIGFLTIYLYTSHGSPEKVVIVLTAGLATLIPIDILRLNVPAAERLFERCVGVFMRESEKRSSNGVIWYLLGADLCLLALPLDVAVVSILILSWADTAASTIGRLWGRYTKALPRRTPVLRLPLAARKSRAGFSAACLTGGLIAVGFWGWLAPASGHPGASWTWEGGVGKSFRDQMPTLAGVAGEKAREMLNGGVHTGGWFGLLILGVVAGMVSGVAEALDLGSLDDNLTLPVIAGSCLWIFFKILGFVAS